MPLRMEVGLDPSDIVLRGDPAVWRVRGKIIRSVLCNCVHLLFSINSVLLLPRVDIGLG